MCGCSGHQVRTRNKETQPGQPLEAIRPLLFDAFYQTQVPRVRVWCLLLVLDPVLLIFFIFGLTKGPFRDYYFFTRVHSANLS